MPALTRRRYPERQGWWHVYYGDVHVGTIAKRIGIPFDENHGNGIAAFPDPIYLHVPAIRLSLSVLLQYLPQSLPPAFAQAGKHFSYEHPHESADAG